jgi:hypothetical protein
VNTHFAFVLGKWMYDNSSFFFLNAPNFSGAQGLNQFADVTDFWREPGDITRFPDWRQGEEIKLGDSRLMSNASFVRLKDLTISYSLPRNVLAKTNNILHNARIFATGRNLLTFTNFSGADPEVDSNLALNVYGNSRQFQLGIELTF